MVFLYYWKMFFTLGIITSQLVQVIPREKSWIMYYIVGFTNVSHMERTQIAMHFTWLKCVLPLWYIMKFLSNNLPKMDSLRCKLFLTYPITCTSYMITSYLWNITIDMIEITRIYPHTTLMDKIKILKSIIEGLNESLDK